MTSSRALPLNAPVITERLVLEPLTAAHADALFEPLQEEAIYRWISATPPEGVECLREIFARRESRLSPGGDEAWLNWAVCRVSDGAHVGKVDVAVNAANVATNVGTSSSLPSGVRATRAKRSPRWRSTSHGTASWSCGRR